MMFCLPFSHVEPREIPILIGAPSQLFQGLGLSAAMGGCYVHPWRREAGFFKERLDSTQP